MGMDGNDFRILNNLIKGVYNAVKCDKHISDFMKFDEGGRTGSVSAPLVYKFCINMITEMKKMGLGVKLMNKHKELIICILAYCDDLLILSDDPSEFQHMLNVCTYYAKKWRFRFHVTSESQIMWLSTPIGHTNSPYMAKPLFR